MAGEFMESVTEAKPTVGQGYSVAPGIVSNNLDFLGEGRVQVRIPTLPAFEPWARVCSVGAGDGRGLVWIPQIDDEVLVAFNQNDERDAYVLGGLWNTLDRPPLTVPTDFLIKRVIKTGVTSGVGHEIEFDDAQQSITITTSTKQKLTMDIQKIELQNTAGTLTISMDNATQTISIQAAKGFELQAPQIKIKGVKVEIEGVNVSIQAAGPCSIQGLPVKIN